MTETFEAIVAQAQAAKQLRLAPALEAETPTQIGVLPGDGIGPSLVAQAKRVLAKLAPDLRLVTIDGLSQAERAAAGVSLPPAVLAQLRQFAVVLKGPLAAAPGQPSPNASLRRGLDLFANLRPMQLDASRAWHFFRENLEGPYLLGAAGMQIDADLAIDFVVETHSQTRRLAQTACAYAVERGLREIAVVTKENVIKLTDGNFLADCQSVIASFPGLHMTSYHIDALAAQLHEPAFGAQLQVVLLPNLYGDIVTDIAAQLQGGLGTAGAANLGARHAVFEAIHGTAPYLIAHGLAEYADPRSILQACVLLLEHIGRREAATRLRAALADQRLPQPAPKVRQVTSEAYVDALLTRL